MKGKKVYLGTNTKMYKGVADTVSYLEELCRLTGDLSREALELFELGAGARDLCVLAYRAAAERRGGGDWRTGPVMV